MVRLGTALLELASVRTWHIPLAASCIFQSTRFTFFSSKLPSSPWTIDNVRQFFIYRCPYVWRYYDFPLYTKSTNELHFLMRSCRHCVPFTWNIRFICCSENVVNSCHVIDVLQKPAHLSCNLKNPIRNTPAAKTVLLESPGSFCMLCKVHRRFALRGWIIWLCVGCFLFSRWN